MRKIIAILFLLCANLVLMVHVIVPHHHHDSMACFIIPVEDEHEDACCTSHEDDHQQKHAGDESNDCCLLNDVMAIIPHQFKPEFYEFDASANQAFNELFLTIIKVTVADEDFLISYKDLRQRPYQAFSYELFASRCLGMRAPPSC